MIDKPDQVERLLRRLADVLPLAALATPALVAAYFREQSSAAKITWHCKVIDILYAGDEGGVMCRVIFDQKEIEQVFLVSITHLAFDRRLPIGREIASYQKHRIKRLRRENTTDAPAAYH